ncbi:MAG: VCBS repeat-containing protein [Chloroflexota bacterium]
MNQLKTYLYDFLTLIAFLGLMLLISLFAPSSSTLVAAQAQAENPTWTYDIPDGDHALYSSPAVDDITGDGIPDIVFATQQGYVIALNHEGSLIFRRRLLDFYSGYSHMGVRGSVAISDIDNDGDKEIVVPTETDGTGNRSVCFPGSVIVLTHTGSQAPGSWPFFLQDESIAPSGCPDGAYATPAVADIDQDGLGEIVIGGLDKRIYALNHDGSLLPGFPPDSALLQRFPIWTGQLQGKLADTIFGGAALVDLTGDGYLEIVLATDEGNFDNRYGGNEEGWYCPYESPLTAGYCGGNVYALTYQGALLENCPIFTWEALQTTPAIADLDGDGTQDIAIGSGEFYQNTVGTNYSNRVNVYDSSTGDFLSSGWNDFPNEPVWGGGKQTDSAVPSSPIIGDITGDGRLEVIAFSKNATLYAWDSSGSAVPGFPMRPLDENGSSSLSILAKQVPILGDFDGDLDMEIILNVQGAMTVIDGDGTQLTSNGSNGRGIYRTGAWPINSPAVGDFNQDGKIDIVTASNRVSVWYLTSSSDRSTWPMHMKSADRIPVVAGPSVAASIPDTAAVSYEAGSNESQRVTFTISNDGSEPVTWTLSDPSNLSVRGVTATASSGALALNQSVDVTLTFASDGLEGQGAGYRSVGSLTLTIEGTQGGGTQTYALPIGVFVATDLTSAFLPFINE